MVMKRFYHFNEVIMHSIQLSYYLTNHLKKSFKRSNQKYKQECSYLLIWDFFDSQPFAVADYSQVYRNLCQLPWDSEKGQKWGILYYKELTTSRSKIWKRFVTILANARFHKIYTNLSFWKIVDDKCPSCFFFNILLPDEKTSVFML